MPHHNALTPMGSAITVFLSSTQRDLADERDRVRDVLRDSGVAVVSMETFRPGPPVAQKV